MTISSGVRRFGLAILIAAAFVPVSPAAVAEAHSGNVRRSDCTHRVSATGERHRHTGRPYCPNISEGFLSEAWMHH